MKQFIFLLIFVASFTTITCAQKNKTDFDYTKKDSSEFYTEYNNLFHNHFLTKINSEVYGISEGKDMLIASVSNSLKLKNEEVKKLFSNLIIRRYYMDGIYMKRSFFSVSKDFFYTEYVNKIIYDIEIRTIESDLKNGNYGSIANKYSESLSLISEKKILIKKINFPGYDTVLITLNTLENNVKDIENYIDPNSDIALKLAVEKNIFEFEKKHNIGQNKKYYIVGKEIAYHKMTTNKDISDYIIEIKQSNSGIDLIFSDKNTQIDKYFSERKGVKLKILDKSSKQEITEVVNYEIGQIEGPEVFIPFWQIKNKKSIAIKVNEYKEYNGKKGYKIKQYERTYSDLIFLTKEKETNKDARDQDLKLEIINSVTGKYIAQKAYITYSPSFFQKFFGLNPKESKSFDVGGSHTIKVKGRTEKKTTPYIREQKFNRKKFTIRFGFDEKEFYNPDVEKITLTKYGKEYVLQKEVNPKYVEINSILTDKLTKEKISETDYDIYIEGQDDFIYLNYRVGNFSAKIPYDLYIANSGIFKINLEPKNGNPTFYEEFDFVFPNKIQKYRDPIFFTRSDTARFKFTFFDANTMQPLKKYKFKISGEDEYRNTPFDREYLFEGETIEDFLPHELNTFNIEYYDATTKQYIVLKSIKKDFYETNKNIDIYVTEKEIETLDMSLVNIRNKYKEKEKFCIKDTSNISNMKNLLDKEIEMGYLSINPVSHFSLEAKLFIIKYIKYREEHFKEKAIKSLKKAECCVYANKKDFDYIVDWLYKLENTNFNNIEDCLEEERIIRNKNIFEVIDSTSIKKEYNADITIKGDILFFNVSNMKFNTQKTYKSGIYYDELFLESLGNFLDTLSNVLHIRTKDLKIRGTIYGETDGTKIKKKGISIRKKQVGKEKLIANYYKAKPTARKIISERDIIIKSGNITTIIVGYGKIYTNPELAFYRAWIVIHKLKQLEIETGGLYIITISADEKEGKDKDKRQTTIELEIELPLLNE